MAGVGSTSASGGGEDINLQTQDTRLRALLRIGQKKRRADNDMDDDDDDELEPSPLNHDDDDNDNDDEDCRTGIHDKIPEKLLTESTILPKAKKRKKGKKERQQDASDTPLLESTTMIPAVDNDTDDRNLVTATLPEQEIGRAHV